MKTKMNLVTAIGLSLCFSSCMSQMSESKTIKEAGFNGSFEIVSESLPVNWLVYTAKTAGSGDFKIFIDEKNAVHGKNGLTFEIKSCSKKGGRFSPGIASEQTANAGDEYKVSMQIKNEGVPYKIFIRGVNATQGDKGTIISGNEKTIGWAKITTNYIIPAKMDKLRIEISALGSGTLSIDDIQIEKINK